MIARLKRERDAIYAAYCRGQFLNQVFHTPLIGDVIHIALRDYRVVSIDGFRIEVESVNSRREQ